MNRFKRWLRRFSEHLWNKIYGHMELDSKAAQEAKGRAEKDLNSTYQQASEVRMVSELLRARKERNHFGESLEEAFRIKQQRDNRS